MLGRKFVITKYVRKTIESKISKLPSQESRKIKKTEQSMFKEENKDKRRNQQNGGRRECFLP